MSEEVPKDVEATKEEEVPTASAADEEAAAAAEGGGDNVVLVSTKKSKFVYVDVTKAMLNEGAGEVEVRGLGTAINTVVSCVEILKGQELVAVTKMATTLVPLPSGGGDGPPRGQVPKLQVFLKKSDNFDALYAEQKAKREKQKEDAKAEGGAAAETAA